MGYPTTTLVKSTTNDPYLIKTKLGCKFESNHLAGKIDITYIIGVSI